ncbi:HPP family protein [Haloarchaeobius salinus]|uniref:HPP family protein n=1 Tax=Haloarchaeobius salinus TaxID=1198298 RepID=UPI00210C41CE|nr:HPP family protein [Haloarchaeobius salinus]
MDSPKHALAGLLLAIPAAVAWASGAAFVFPSLGPTAFVLTNGQDPGPRRVVGGHVVGALAGLLAHRAVAVGLVVQTEAAAFAPAQGRVALAGVLALAATAVGMRATGTVHPPACATTLIVALGLLATVVDVAVIVLGVCLLYAAFRAGTHVIDNRAGRTVGS